MKKTSSFFRNKEAEYNGKIIGKLDLDDTSSYGPETITTTVKKNVVSSDNKFSYSIHDYSNKNSMNSNQLSLSGATIHVYSGNNLINKFIVPKDKVGTVWHAFDITSSGIKKINNFYNCSNPTEVR